VPGERLGDVALRHQSKLVQHQVQTFAARLAHAQRPLQTVVVLFAGLDQQPASSSETSRNSSKLTTVASCRSESSATGEVRTRSEDCQEWR
jgi:hypothetical protein